jgi:hypothetical protein
VSARDFVVTIGGLLLSFGIGAGPAAAAPFYGLHYDSSFASSIGHGETVFADPERHFDSLSSAGLAPSASLYVSNVGLEPDPQAWESWSLVFASPGYAVLEVGHYEGVTRYEFAASDAPQVYFTRNGQGASELSGYFDVLQVTYGFASSLVSFAADFALVENGNPDAWLGGSVRFNSEIPFAPVPEPTLLALLVPALLALRECGSRRGSGALRGSMTARPRLRPRHRSIYTNLCRQQSKRTPRNCK